MSLYEKRALDRTAYKTNTITTRINAMKIEWLGIIRAKKSNQIEEEKNVAKATFIQNQKIVTRAGYVSFGYKSTKKTAFI